MVGSIFCYFILTPAAFISCSLDLTLEDNHSLLTANCSICLITLLEQNLVGLSLFLHAGFMLLNDTDCKGASDFDFNPQKKKIIRHMQNSKNVRNSPKCENSQNWINPLYITTFPHFSMARLGWKSVLMFCCEGVEFCDHSDLFKVWVSLLLIYSATWIRELRIQPHIAHTTFKWFIVPVSNIY